MKIFLVSDSFWGILGQLWFAASGFFLLKLLVVGERSEDGLFSRLSDLKRKFLG